MAKKILSILLASVILLTMLAACNNEPVEDVKDPDDQQQEIEDPNENEGGEEMVVSKTVDIVVDGVSEYVIVRGENASPSEITAASELQNYLKQISGVEIAIVTDSTEAVEKEIIVGKTNREADGEFDREELGDDGFVIKTVDSKLYLVGGEKRGTLYSVYTFLEEYLGCRFYTATVEKIPEMKTVSLEQIAEDKQIPVFEYRDIDWVPSRQGTFQAKLKANGIYAPLGEDFGGHYSYVGFVHTMNSLVPYGQYYAEHPEYFSDGFAAYAAGESDPWGYGQPCLSNPEVVKIATANARQWLIDNPNANIISISQNDNQKYCTCDECNKILAEEGSQAGVLLRFVNAIATELKDEFPNVRFDTLAYQYTRNIPAVTKPVDNVIVRLCTIECCFSHPLGTCEDVGKSDDITKSIYEDIQDWAKVSDKLYVWDYVTNYGHTCSFFPNFNSMLANVKFFADNHVVGLYEEANYFDDLSDFPELRAYILGKIMWDPYMSEEEYWGHIDDFLEGVYGPGWTHIREFINIAQEETADVCFGIGPAPEDIFKMKGEALHGAKDFPENLTADMIRNYETTDWSQFWNFYSDIPEAPKVVSEGEKLFAKAYEMAETDAQRAIIDKTSISMDYIKSTYWGTKLGRGSGAIGRMLSNYFKAYPDEFTDDEKTSFRMAIVKYSKDQVMNEYIEFNKNLVNKMLSYGIEKISEQETIYPDFTWSSNKGESGPLLLEKIPSDWTD